MDIFFRLLVVSLMSSALGYSYQRERCNHDASDMVIIVDCNYPPLHWNMIRHLMNMFNLTNLPDKLTVTLVDLKSRNNLTLNDFNIGNVSGLCEENSEQYDNALSRKHFIQLTKHILGIYSTSRKVIFINIIQCLWADYFSRNVIKQLYSHRYRFDSFNIIILNSENCGRVSVGRNTIMIDKQDDLIYNNELSIKLCHQCLDGWFPAYEENGTKVIKSCFLFEKQRKPFNWQEAANYCVKKKSHLATFETYWELKYLHFNMVGLANNFSNITFVANESLFIHVGLFTLNLINSEHLFWINYNPVSYFMYQRLDSVVDRRLNSLRICFAWNKNQLQTGIEVFTQVECKVKNSMYTLCEQDELERFEQNRKSMTYLKIENYTIPSTNFVLHRTTIYSLSAVSFVRFDIVFPTFVCYSSHKNVSYNYVCNGFKDCPLGEDEQVCSYSLHNLNTCLEDGQYVCPEPNVHGLVCISQTHLCNLIEDCPDGSDELNCDDCMFTRCSDDICIPEHWQFNCSFLNQNVNNIASYNKDIKEFNTFNNSAFDFNILLESITFCDRSKGDSNNYFDINTLRTYNTLWTPRCLYMKNRYGKLLGCSDVSHLSNCTFFACPIGFSKCWNSYCIPDRFILDGFRDCPNGEDEIDTLSTRNYYLGCYSSNRRLHPSYICDGKHDCPNRDDELNCVDDCPSGFICLDGTAAVSDTNTLLNTSSLSPNTTFLNISGIDVSRAGTIMQIASLKKLLVFIASRCNVQVNLQYKSEQSSIYHLDISYNNIIKLVYRDFFSQFSHLQFLNVSFNYGLQEIASTYFQQFKKLKLLDLSHTEITSVMLKNNYAIRFLNLSMTNLRNVLLYKKKHRYDEQYYEIIDLRNTHISESIEENYFSNISVKGKILANYKMCCPYFRGAQIQAHQCEADILPLSTCEDLIGDVFKRALLWTVAILAVIGNVVVLSYRILFERATFHLTYIAFVTCLGVSDFLMGIYLLIIASVDTHFRGTYIVHETTWRQSMLCQIAGAMATMSSETSNFFILLITLERFLVIKFPFGEYKISSVSKYFSVSISWLVGILISLIPIMHRDMTLYSTSGMCLGFPLRKSTGVAWIYSVVVFIFLNSFLFVFIAIGQFAIFKSIVQQRFQFQNTELNRVRRAENVTVALRLSLVVLSNFICWFPICVMGIRTVMSDYEVTRETYAWIVTIVMPANSALNPVLYTGPRIYKYWTDYKRGTTSRSSNSSL